MNHRPFEDWLLTDDPLSPEERRELQAHLRDCERCRQLERGLASVTHAFRAASFATPAPGFTIRWQENLTARRLARQRRLSWLLFFISGAIAIALLTLIGSQVVALLRSPGQIQLIRAYGLTVILALAEVTRAITVALGRITISLPFLWIFMFSGVTSFLCALWVVAYRQAFSRLSFTTRRVLG